MMRTYFCWWYAFKNACMNEVRLSSGSTPAFLLRVWCVTSGGANVMCKEPVMMNESVLRRVFVSVCVCVFLAVGCVSVRVRVRESYTVVPARVHPPSSPSPL
ncbi:hypothetical protein DQ04_06661000 [Trypanosoma grayi]|uniref:hypothetical protein n=1 Tax=Trypanosoma grayi TaxID=71804 RepID=UPI0004F43D12|nr:hypothetical protein DQ04_06661000 [Trypanosoma grayi]KEG08675.1 hypothetical protein DQ04_06661000 [Trypanosoma grayi]